MFHIHRNSRRDYYNLFDYETGIAVRWGKNEEHPFWKEEGPELLDISITNYCERECDFCYRKADQAGSFMNRRFFEEILQQADNIGVQQIALGGGNPNQHPEFVEFLQMARKHHIMASYTTNGQGMSDDIYIATKRYGGAVAVSWYEPYIYAKNVIEACAKYHIPVNIHFVLNKESLKNAIDLLHSNVITWDIVNAIVFLNYKPLGSKIYEGLCDNEELDMFFKSVLAFDKCKIGFDSCMISWLMKYKEGIADESIDFCEAGRFSAFIKEDGWMFPCSFLSYDRKYGEDLKKRNMEDIWHNGEAFIEMRQSLFKVERQSVRECKKCDSYQICHGGCPKFNNNRC